MTDICLAPTTPFCYYYFPFRRLSNFIQNIIKHNRARPTWIIGENRVLSTGRGITSCNKKKNLFASLGATVMKISLRE